MAKLLRVLLVVAVGVAGDDRDGPAGVGMDLRVGEPLDLGTERAEARVELVGQCLGSDEPMARDDPGVELIDVLERGDAADTPVVAREPAFGPEHTQPARCQIVPSGDVREEVVEGPAAAGLLVHLRAADVTHGLAEAAPALVHPGQQLLRSSRDRGTRHTSPSRLGPVRPPSPPPALSPRTPAS